MSEIWRDIVGYENYYQVSNLGRVRSKDRETRNGVGKIVKKGKILKAQSNTSGYLRINLKIPNKREYKFVHRLVAIAFIDNPDNKPCVNHIDSNSLNNCAENLEWITHLDNIHHAINKGRFNEHFKRTTQIFNKSNQSLQRPVKGTSIKTGEVIRFKSINDAGRYFSGRAGDICKCCKGERKTAQGYKWEYC